MTIRHDRRRFLKGAAFGAGGLLLGNMFPKRALAQSMVGERKFVFAYFDGGWDILMGLDPRGPDIRPDTHDIDPGWDRLGGVYRTRGVQSAGNLSFGPAIPPEMLAHANDVSIVNAVGMDTASHEVGRRYFITGRFPRGISAVGSSAASEIIAQLGDDTPIPNIAAAVESYATGLPAHATALNVNTLTDLTVALTPFAEIDPSVLAAMRGFHNDAKGCVAKKLDRTGLSTQLLQNQQRARTYIEAQLSSVFDVTRQDAEMAALLQLYGINNGDPASPEILSFVAGQALKQNISQAVTLRAAGGLDTHSNWAADQPTAQEQGWRAIAALMTDLKQTPLPSDNSKSVFDVTTFVVFSEFGRTPMFNNLQGRDHFLGNSCLVAGPGMKRGVTIGESAVRGMMPYATNLDTGTGVPTPSDAEVAGGRVQTMSPKHVLATVIESVGLDSSYLRTDPIKALLT